MKITMHMTFDLQTKYFCYTREYFIYHRWEEIIILFVIMRTDSYSQLDRCLLIIIYCINWYQCIRSNLHATFFTLQLHQYLILQDSNLIWFSEIQCLCSILMCVSFNFTRGQNVCAPMRTKT